MSLTQTDIRDSTEPTVVPTRRWWVRRPALAAGVLVGLLAVSSTAAYAYWTTTGTGTATATAGTTAAVTITGTVTGTIYPGGSFPVEFTVDNPNATTAAIGTVSATAFDSDIAGCDTLIAEPTFVDFSMANVAQNFTISANANDEALPNDGSLVFGNSPLENQNACKGAVITITLSATAGA
jgi:hypothetical protein